MSDAFIEAAAVAACPTTNARVVLLEIAVALSRWGQCFYSVGEIAKRTCLPTKAVRRALDYLVTAGVVEWRERRGAHGCRLSNDFRLTQARS
jgi:predicted ArsR family transcriptional regulator